jgi:hypothetical protein
MGVGVGVVKGSKKPLLHGQVLVLALKVLNLDASQDWQDANVLEVQFKQV